MAASVDDYLNDPETTEAEKALIADCREGRPCLLNGGKLPEEGATRPRVRAALIRLLALEATSLHEKGVWLEGAVIAGELDLSFARCRGGVVLNKCRFDEQPRMEQTELAQLSLVGSHFPGLFAPGARVTGSVSLRGVTATGTVDVKAAQIGGQLDCDGATLEVDKGKALNGQSLRMKGAFVFRKVKAVAGRVVLTSAEVRDLVDDAESCRKCSDLILDGFTYDRIGGDTSPRTFATRKAWLENGSHFRGEFFPQPYTQFAKVMRAAGHVAEARKALVERDRLLFAEAEKADRAALGRALSGDQAARADGGKIWLRMQGRRLWAGLTHRVVGYGHRPERALFWVLGCWLAGTLLYFVAYRAGLMVPNSDVIMVSAEWLEAVQADRLAPTALWTGDAIRASAHYETFFAGIYALDLFLPVVDLGQEKAWAVTTPVPFGWGWWLRVASFLYQVAGWVMISLGLAAVTGLVQRNGPE